MADIFARVSHVWSNPSEGTPPFTSSLWLQSATGVDPDTLGDWLDDYLSGPWGDIDGSMYDGLGAGIIKAVATIGGVEVERSRTLPAPPGGTAPRGPGFSLRAKFVAPRPKGARQNGCYFPLANSAAYDNVGTIIGGTGDAYATYGEDIVAMNGDHDWIWVSRYGVAPDGSGGTSQENTGCELAPTISWLQRRYR